MTTRQPSRPSAAAEFSKLLDVERLGERVEHELRRFLLSRLSRFPMDSIDRSLMEPIVDLVLVGGKRLRAAFCYWGWRAAGGDDSDVAVAAAAALELLHAFALIHDDVMDDSVLRRGRPTMHRRFATDHAAAGWLGTPEEFGRSAAILAGDLCAVWADVLLRESGLPLPALRRAAAVYDTMRGQTIRGQYLDLVSQAAGRVTAEDAWRIAGAKTARSTTTGPLLFGAALADGDESLRQALAGYAEPLGVAFQLRDDLLGAFGDPAVTGKPCGDDLRDGKCTLLLAHARAVSQPGDRNRIDHLVRQRSEEAAVELREVLIATGARTYVEQRINALGRQALSCVDQAAIPPLARRVLTGLAIAITRTTERQIQPSARVPGARPNQTATSIVTLTGDPG